MAATVAVLTWGALLHQHHAYFRHLLIRYRPVPRKQLVFDGFARSRVPSVRSSIESSRRIRTRLPSAACARPTPTPTLSARPAARPAPNLSFHTAAPSPAPLTRSPPPDSFCSTRPAIQCRMALGQIYPATPGMLQRRAPSLRPRTAPAGRTCSGAPQAQWRFP